MPGYIKWLDDDETIMCHIYTGEAIPSDYYRVIDESYRLTRSKDHTVHIIHDRTMLRSAPANMVAIMRYANQRIPANTGIRVVVGASFLTRVFIDIGRTVAPNLVRQTYYADDLDAAVQFIREQTAATR